MGKRSEFVEHVVEMMRAFGPVEAKAMFGGWGLYHQRAPDEALESPVVMAEWARYGYESALRAAAAKAKPATPRRSPARSRRGS